MVELLHDLRTSEETAENTKISNVLKEVNIIAPPVVCLRGETDS